MTHSEKYKLNVKSPQWVNIKMCLSTSQNPTWPVKICWGTLIVHLKQNNLHQLINSINFDSVFYLYSLFTWKQLQSTPCTKSTGAKSVAQSSSPGVPSTPNQSKVWYPVKEMGLCVVMAWLTLGHGKNLIAQAHPPDQCSQGGIWRDLTDPV